VEKTKYICQLIQGFIYSIYSKLHYIFSVEILLKIINKNILNIVGNQSQIHIGIDRAQCRNYKNIKQIIIENGKTALAAQQQQKIK